MPEFSTFLSLTYWFDLSPTPFTTLVHQVLFAVFAIVAVVGIALRVWTRRNRQADRFVREALARAANAALTLGLLGLVWLFFSYEQVSLFGARFWMVAWAVGAVIWVVVILRRLYGVAPKVREEEKARAEKAKYLPRPKK